MDKGLYGRRDRLVREHQHDTYREEGKWPEPTLCVECGAVFVNGRWTWQDESPLDANEVTCPACRRMADDYPAGTIDLQSSFLEQHGEEVRNLILNEEQAEKQEHPLERIMQFREEPDHWIITTTGIHVARRIGEAVARAYQGRLELAYGDGEKSIRVSWRR